MRQSCPLSVRRYGALVGVVLCLVGMFAGAQPAAQSAAPASPLVQLLIVDVKPEAWDDYVALQKAETMPALQKAGIERRRAWRSAGLGQSFRVAYLTPIPSMAVYDDKPAIVRALGEQAAKTYNAKLRRYLNGARYLVIRTRGDLSFGLDGPPSKLGVVAHVHTVMGKQFAFEGFLKDQWAPALKKAGVAAYVVQEVVMGGEMGEYYSFTPITNFAALDSGHPIMKSLGPAEYQALLEKMGGTIRSVDREVMRLDEELSFDTKGGTK